MTYTTIYNDPKDRATKIHYYAYWDDCFTEDDIQNIINYCDSKELEVAKTLGSDDEEEVKKVRISDVGFHGRTPETELIFDKLNYIIQSANEMFFNFHLNGYDSFQYTTYDSSKAGNYDWHMDMSMENDTFYQPRKLSLSLLLSEPGVDFEGGNFQLNSGNQHDPITAQFKKGRAILFPSFMCHRVEPVTKGVRKSIVVWVVGPKFV